MLDCQGSLEALVLLAERETQDNLDRMDHLEPRGLMGWRARLGLRDLKATQVDPEPEDLLESRGCQVSRDLRASPVCRG